VNRSAVREAVMQARPVGSSADWCLAKEWLA
jgi:hypothetical protein